MLGFSTLSKKANGLSDTSSSDDANNPSARPPQPNFIRVGENRVISRACSATAGDIAASSSDIESNSRTCVYQSDPEQYREPTARQRLGELLRLRPYQSDPNGVACAERIKRLGETVRKEGEDELGRQRSVLPGTDSQSVSSGRESSHSGISICTDDIPPNYNPPLLIRSNPISAEGIERDRWLNDGIPHPIH